MRGRWLGAVVTLSVAFYVGAALYLGNTVEPLPGTYDQLSYDSLAMRVAHGHGFTFAEAHWPATRAEEPTAHWSFLYTCFLATVYRVFGHEPIAARLLQAVLVGALLPLGLYRLGCRTFDQEVGLIAAVIVALYAYFVYYGASLMTEMPVIVAIVWALVVMYEIEQSPSVGKWAALGALAALVALLRQVAVVPLGLAAVWLLRRRSSRDVAGALIACLVATVLILPVTVRNWHVFGRFVPINTNAGYAFFWANHPIHGTNFQSILEEGPGYYALIPEELRDLDEAAMSDALLARGLEFVRDDPGRFAMLSASRLADYFIFWPSSSSSAISNAARVVSFGLMLPFALHGLALSLGAWRRRAPLYVFAASYTVIHLLSWALVRYRLPVDAVLVVFAAASVRSVGSWAAGRLSASAA